jgi:hypothetical protein
MFYLSLAYRRIVYDFRGIFEPPIAFLSFHSDAYGSEDAGGRSNIRSNCHKAKHTQPYLTVGYSGLTAPSNLSL